MRSVRLIVHATDTRNDNNDNNNNNDDDNDTEQHRSKKL